MQNNYFFWKFNNKLFLNRSGDNWLIFFVFWKLNKTKNFFTVVVTTDSFFLYFESLKKFFTGLVTTDIRRGSLLRLEAATSPPLSLERRRLTLPNKTMTHAQKQNQYKNKNTKTPAISPPLSLKRTLFKLLSNFSISERALFKLIKWKQISRW